MFNRRGDRPLDRLVITYIGGNAKALAAIVLDDLFHGLEIFDLTAGDREAAVFSKCTSDAARDPRSAACYKRDFTL